MWLLRNNYVNCCKCSCNEKLTQKTNNIIYAAVCGSLVSAGWWCFIDAFSVHPNEFAGHGWFVLPGIGATIAFVIVNVLAKLPTMQVNAIYMSRTAIWCLRFLLFIGFFLAFSMIFAAALLFALQWSIVKPRPPAGWSYGFAIPQTILICAATFLFYFGIDIDAF